MDRLVYDYKENSNQLIWVIDIADNGHKWGSVGSEHSREDYVYVSNGHLQKKTTIKVFHRLFITI